ncbi:MAG: diacylglycerol kinase family lipid kinase [Candidatus Lokiarchaeota archaeon]|nr:diacylglycerol kinase family lipid kinase [Candidatus Lokiarchaeota archaeon]
MVDYAIVYNSMANKGKVKEEIEDVKKYLKNLNVSFDLHATEYVEHAIQLANQLAKDGYRVIGAGGDGTANEVLHGVITSNTGALCGFIPMGSGNDIPAAIGYRADIKRACEIIAEGYSGKTDIGRAKKDDGTERYFLGIGSQGFDSEVARRSNEEKEKDYNMIILDVLKEWESQEIIVKMDNDTFEGEATLAAVGLSGAYGGGMFICQRASLEDGLFDISIVNIDKIKLARQFRRMYNASLLPHPDIQEYQSKKVRIEMRTFERESYVSQVDGEVLGPLPINYECIQDGYEFIRPKINEFAEEFKEKYGHYFWECTH